MARTVSLRAARAYTHGMSQRPNLEPRQDKRDLGRYSIPQAASFIGMPSRTMRNWFLGKSRIFEPSYHRGGSVLLSFNDVTEAYIIEVLRSHYGFSPVRLRHVVDDLRNNSATSRPLAKRELIAIPEFQSLVDKRTHKGKQINIDVARGGNLVFHEFVNALGRRVQRDSRGRASRLLPWRDAVSEDAPLSIDPNVMSGELVVSGTRIPAMSIRAEFKAGHALKEIAELYSLSIDTVRKVISHFEPTNPQAA